MLELPSVVIVLCNMAQVTFNIIILSFQRNLTPQPVRERFFSDSDFLVLEDELQRVVLTGDIDVQTAITGTIHYIQIQVFLQFSVKISGTICF